MIKVYHKDGEWEVWMDTESGERDGICLGTAPKIADALNQAKAEITIAESALNIFQSADLLQVELPCGLKIDSVTVIGPLTPPPAPTPPVPAPKSDDCPF